MPKPRRIKALETIARKMVGVRKTPNLFFVTDQGSVVTITRDFPTAYAHWQKLSTRSPRVECALEDRRTGVIASVEPESDEPGARLIVLDDSHRFKYH